MRGRSRRPATMSEQEAKTPESTRRTFIKAAGAVTATALAGAGAFSILARRRPNVVFIISDALRADRLGAANPLGGSLTPFLDEAARKGAVFTNCLAPSSWTLPSVAGMVSSRNPVVTGEYYTESYAAGAPTFAAELARAGYFTFSVVKNPWLPARRADRELMKSIVTKGFSRYELGSVRLDDNPFHAEGIGAPREVRAFDPPERVTDEAAEIFQKLRAGGDRRPFLLYLHYMNTHQPYTPSPAHTALADAAAPPVEAVPDHLIYQVLAARGRERDYALPIPTEELPMLRRAEALYNAATFSVDAAVARLVERIDDAGELENTIFIFTSDHGEEFGERGHCGHSITLYQECIHVPFVMWGAGVPAGFSSDRLLRGIDFAPGIVKLALGTREADFAGGTFFRSSGGGEHTEAIACTVSPILPRMLDTVTLSIVESTGRKFIMRRPAAGKEGPTSVELYDLRTDPYEQRNLAGVASTERFEVRMRRYWEAAAARPAAERLTVDRETEEALRSLGYLN